MIWILLLSLSLPSVAWANGETLYVRPAGGSYGTEAGTSYANAWDGFINIVYNAANTAGQVDPGDTLYVCGAHTAEQMEVYQDGTAALPIEIRFDCPSDPGSIEPTAQNYALYVEASYLKIHGGTLGRGSLYTLLLNTNGGIYTDTSGVEVYDMTIRDCLNTSTECLGYYGADVYLHDIVMYDGANDGIHSHGGLRARIIDNTISRISTGGTNGDCIQLSISASGSLVQGNSCDHTNIDSKYCIIVDSETVAGVSLILNNICIRRSTDTVGSGMRANEGAIFVGNTITGGQYGIQCAVTIAATQCDVTGNLIITPKENCILLGSNSTVSQLYNNTCVNPGLEGVLTANNGAGVTIKNNIVSTSYAQCIDKQTNNVEGYNDLYGCSTPVSNSNVGTGMGTGTITANPLFTSMSDYRPIGTSPTRRTGQPFAGRPCTDPRGRPCWTPPDIGAYQSTSGDPAAPRTVRN